MRNRNCRCQSNCNNNCRRQNSWEIGSCNMYNINNTNCACINRNNMVSNNLDCNCIDSNNNSNVFPNNYLYGYAYTPVQTMNKLFEPQTGLDNGSMFPELVSPYSPGQSMDFIEYLKTTGRNGGCDCE